MSYTPKTQAAIDAINAYRDYVSPFELGQPFTRGVWFSLTHLKEIIAKLETEKAYLTAQATPGNQESGYGITDGARIYFARHRYEQNGIDYGDRNTLYFVSTKQGNLDSIEGLIHEDYLTMPSLMTSNELTEDEIPADPENTGELSPPRIKGIDEEFLPVA